MTLQGGLVVFLGTCMLASAGTVAYYPFGSSVTADVSGNGNHAVVLSGAPSIAGGSLSLGTNDALQFNYAFPFDYGDATLEFWIKPDSSPGEQDLFWTTTAAGDANRFNIYLSGGAIGIDYRNAAGTIQPVTTAHGITANQWTFVAIVLSGNTWSVYLNQNTLPAASVTLASGVSLPTSTGWTLNGRAFTQPAPAGPFFSGLVSNLRISDVALPPSAFLVGVPEPSTATLLLIGGFALIAGTWLARMRRTAIPTSRKGTQTTRELHRSEWRLAGE